MLLQRIKETFTNVDDAFYVSLDNLWFNAHPLSDLVAYLYTRGITHLFFDEVHKYQGWIATLKNLYDNYPDLQIVYTGSSMLEIDNSKSDLSRRQSLYTLNGLSFREYLEYEGLLKTEPVELTDLLQHHVDYAMDVTSKIKVLKAFDTYLKSGYYPFYKEAGKDYYMRINEVVSLVIESDLPSVEEVKYATIEKSKKLLMILAENVPLIPNISLLGGQLEATRDMCLKLLYWLDKAGLLYLLTNKIKSYKSLAKPEKIYLNNTNLMYALSANVNRGSERETFFANQAGAVHQLTMPNEGDFLVDGKYLFEVGGSGKTFDQIAGNPDSRLAVDDAETGYGNRIPLWMFGMLY